MKKFLLRIIRFFTKKKRGESSNGAKISFIGSWLLVSLVDSQGRKQFPCCWKGVWSFAAMDSVESNGIYACEHISMHTIAGKWELKNSRLKLVCKECESEYALVELSAEYLVLKPIVADEDLGSLIFRRVV